MRFKKNHRLKPKEIIKFPLFNYTSHSIRRIENLFIYYIIFMSLFYQVMGAIRCPKIKKHVGVKLRPINKAKEPFIPGDMLIYSCESTEFTQSIKCLDDGKWSDLTHCPDPTNSTCPSLGPLLHGTYNSTEPHKVSTVVLFKCNNEIQTQNQSQKNSLLTTSENVRHLGYHLVGQPMIRCLPSSKWSHPMPMCSPNIVEPPSKIGFILASIFVLMIPILISIAIVQLFIKWKKRQQQRARWKQYFTDYKYRHSKTSITFGTRPQNPTTTIPVTDL